MKNCGRAETRHREGWRVTREVLTWKLLPMLNLMGQGAVPWGRRRMTKSVLLNSGEHSLYVCDQVAFSQQELTRRINNND